MKNKKVFRLLISITIGDFAHKLSFITKYELQAERHSELDSEFPTNQDIVSHFRRAERNIIENSNRLVQKKNRCSKKTRISTGAQYCSIP